MHFPSHVHVSSLVFVTAERPTEQTVHSFYSDIKLRNVRHPHAGEAAHNVFRLSASKVLSNESSFEFTLKLIHIVAKHSAHFQISQPWLVLFQMQFFKSLELAKKNAVEA